MIHQAAAYLDSGVQFCARCGVVLIDYRHVTWAPGQTLDRLRWWPTFAAVEVAGASPQEQIATDKAPTCQVRTVQTAAPTPGKAPGPGLSTETSV